MILYPAIDLKDGQCVRLMRGEMDAATVYNPDPLAQALAFQREGVEWLHIVDLNGAVEGRAVHADILTRIANDTGCRIQLGGGIRTILQISRWLELGIARVILGTAALNDPALVYEACQQFPGQVAVGIDAKDGFVAVEGWYKTSTVKVIDLALKLQDAGASAFIFTDITRDGTQTGLNIPSTVSLAEAVKTPVIASGGVGSLQDLKDLKATGMRNILGAIVGRALYEHAFTITEARAVLADVRAA